VFSGRVPGWEDYRETTEILAIQVMGDVVDEVMRDVVSYVDLH
jgi:hypothetical protein